MNPFHLLRIEIIKRPIFNLLLVLLSFFGGNLWWAIISLTLIIRLLLVKNAMAATKMQGHMTDFQPKMQELQEKHKDDPQRMSSEMINLFKKDGGGPLKWCLSMLVQIPVFLWLFFNVKDIALENVHPEIYSFLSRLHVDIATIDTNFLWINLLDPNNIILTVVAAILMYLQMKTSTMFKPATPKIPGMWDNMPDMSKMMGGMNIFFVFMMGAFVRQMPAAVGLYIVTTTLFGVVQQTVQYWPMIKLKWFTKPGSPEIISG